jgi:hypothetical protein
MKNTAPKTFSLFKKEEKPQAGGGFDDKANDDKQTGLFE